MKTFKEFTAQRKYVAVIYDADSQKKLREWAEANGFDLTVSFSGDKQSPSDFDFHSTIFYTSNEVNLLNVEKTVPPTEVTISGMKLLGENNDVPVLSVELSGGIQQLREYFEQQGLEDKWPTYLPHISVSYGSEPRDVESISIPTFKPKFDKLVIRDIED